MIQHFATLFTVAIQHSYYTGNNCEDFEFFVPSSTASAMQGGKVLARVLAGRLHVLYEAEKPGVPINSLVGQTLLFGLRLTNSSFSNFTNPVGIDAKQTPFYSNSNNPTVLEPAKGIVVASGICTHPPQTSTRPLTLTLSDAIGNSLASQTLLLGEVDGCFDLRALPEGHFRIDEFSEVGNVSQTRLFVSPELRSTSLWGLVAIKIDAGFYAAPPTFTLDFTARQEQLQYFVVANQYSEADFGKLNVVDNGEKGRTKVDFDRVLPASFSSKDIAPELLGDASRVVMFRSQLPVARNEHGFRNIQLKRNGDEDSVLVSHLPQPSADRPQARFIIHLSKPDPNP